ncbi:MAG: hypothetical protein ACRELF_06470, partial [Gemmataceae bacterium]
MMLLGLSGCRSKVATIVEEIVPEDTTTHLGDKMDISLADWLKLPRAEQAKLVEEWTETVGKQRAFARGNVESVALLPRLHPPVVAAVFAEAKFSPSAGFSLPPYLNEGQKDAAVALHLARFGDREAALKLADVADKDLLAKIDAVRGDRDYPVEWSRLVALVLQNAELKLANGETDGATELVLLHRQLRSLLDAKSAPRALGAALLPRGRQALTLAAIAWREPRQNKTALAADIDAALADWGATPDPVPGLNAGAKQVEVVSLMGSEVQGRAVLARTPAAVQRTLDLLALPLPSEGAAGVAAFLDDKQTLTEVQVVYRAKINDLFPEPQQLALPLVEHSFPSENPASSPGLARQNWTGGGLAYEVAVLTRGSVGGALVRVGRAGGVSPLLAANTGLTPPARLTRNPRDFGAVNLDRSFEQNRLGLAPDQAGTTLEIKDAAELARITHPATKFTLAAAVLKRETDADLLAALTLRWSADQNSNALSQLVLPLWAAYGPAVLESAEETSGGRFTLTWQDETTRLRLHLPFEDKSPELLAEDSRGPAALKKRVEAAAVFDHQERQNRLAASKPRERLARFVQLPTHGIDDLRLGMTREQVQAVLPGARSLRVMALSDGLNILILNEPPATAAFWPRQLFVRFGTDNRVAEIRVRYQERPHASGPKSPGLLDKLQAKPNGAPETLPAPWVGLWTDVPTRKQPVFYRWLDDVTSLTYQRDVGGSEVVLRDCPKDKAQGDELPPLLFCGRGIEACNLGDALAEVHKRWQVRNSLLASNGAEVLVMPANSPYDVLLIWYDNDKVSKLIARHRNPKTLKENKVNAALQQAWGADLDRLGFVRRQDGTRGQVVRAYSYHDDRTRVRLFAQETKEGIRVFTEWRE